MNIQRLAFGLTIINLGLLMVVVVLLGRPMASPDVTPVLRGRALEIVDEQGRVRAQITILPATTQAGKTYAETVLLRLIDPNGRPAVKLGASVDGSGLGLAGDSERRDWSGVQILAEGTGSTVKLVNKDGRAQTIQP